VILVNPEKHASVKKELGQAFIDWVVSPEGRQTSRSLEQLFFPNATRMTRRGASCSLVVAGANLLRMIPR
jgi:ABC-type tungstate transport system permease subunit